MADLDLTCDQAAEQVLARSRDEARTLTAIRSALAAEGRVLAMLADHVAGEQPTADKPRRRNRTIRIARDADGAMAAEDVTGQPEPAATDAPPIEEEPAPGFADVFGSLGGLDG